jgi:hypothetical protein
MLVNTERDMSDDPPRPPKELPDDLAETLDGCSPSILQAITDYAEDLAEYRARNPAPLQSDDVEAEVPNGDPDEDPREDRPDEVPVKATVTVKEINDNRYYYWQWREGDTVKSKYKGPVER